ncbi:MAG: hypothetical protein HY013_17650 [Candidatus Solibacter usitatus]|nr:hypothetical protein [Candidatus Solibacter usitatus]
MRAQDQLIEENIGLLWQGSDLLARLDDAAYVRIPSLLPPHRVGGHLRHCLECYECFLDGVERGAIDYDARRRDPRLETRREEAMMKILSLADRLDALRYTADRRVRVRMEDAPAGIGEGGWLASTTARELQVLRSHTVHHYALISMTLRALGIHVDAGFGMAPSTIRHLRGAA